MGRWNDFLIFNLTVCHQYHSGESKKKETKYEDKRKIYLEQACGE